MLALMGKELNWGAPMLLTIYGVAVLASMMLLYALENRHRHFVLAFAVSCILSGLYGLVSGVWPFGVVEVIWSVIAFRRWRNSDGAQRVL